MKRAPIAGRTPKTDRRKRIAIVGGDAAELPRAVGRRAYNAIDMGSLASATVQPSSSTLLTSRARPLGVNLACL
ncbi:MAG TPA: hypothetical protein PL196_05525, partial [Burkholderiaceae bacterium]|nr:hypothetical protein [Burkholderiaceae bacterium]